MDNFFIDKLGNDDDCKENEGKPPEIESDEDEFLNIRKFDFLDKLPNEFEKKKTKPCKNKKVSLDDTYLIASYKDVEEEGNNSVVDKILKKSKLKEGLEKEHQVPDEKSNRQLKEERRKLRQRTKGKDWFNIPATEVTEEIKTDFELLKMRSVLDSKHVYKKNDFTHTPKYFEVGRVVEGPADFYSGRIPKSQRKKTLVDELLADAEFKRYQKKKFKEIVDDNRRRRVRGKSFGGKLYNKKKSKK